MSTTTTKPITHFLLSDLEAQILDLEGIRIVFRAPARLRLTGISYADKNSNRSAGNANITTMRARIAFVMKNATNGNSKGWLAKFPIDEITYDVIDGKGNTPNGRTLVSTVRNSYVK